MQKNKKTASSSTSATPKKKASFFSRQPEKVEPEVEVVPEPVVEQKAVEPEPEVEAVSEPVIVEPVVVEPVVVEPVVEVVKPVVAKTVQPKPAANTEKVELLCQDLVNNVYFKITSKEAMPIAKLMVEVSADTLHSVKWFLTKMERRSLSDHLKQKYDLR